MRVQASTHSSVACTPSASEIEHLAIVLRERRDRQLRRRPVDEILAALAQAVEAWLRPDSSIRLRAEAELPAVTGFSSPMIRHGLPLMLAPLSGDAIGRLLDRELGDRHALDRSAGPQLILHVLSGNIPALGAAPLALSLAIKSAAILKVSRADGLLTTSLIESMREIDADLGECAAALHWPGGRLDVEAVAFNVADLVVASGADATIADVARRISGRFIGHGHRISFAVVTREALNDPAAAAAQLAYDIALWDQHGCLSPQLAYVERGGAVSVEQFAEGLGAQLERLAQELPLRQLSLEEQAAIGRFRHEAEWRSVRGEEVTVIASTRGLRWTVVYDAAPVFAPTPLNRTIWVKPIASVADLPRLLGPAHPYLEAAGVAAAPARLAELTQLLAQAGVHRVCPLGEMQRPDLTWCPGGRPRVAEWMSFRSTSSPSPPE